MIILWDEHKRIKNRDKHGLDFSEFRLEFLTKATIEESNSNRFKAIFFMGIRKIAVIFKPLGREAITLISMRPASKKERDKLK